MGFDIDLNIGLNKMIVVGLDGTGKTTACKKLVNDGFEYLKFSVNDGKDKVAMAMHALEGTKDTDKFVFDRFYFPDELVYFKYTGKDKTTIGEWLEVMAEIRKQGISIVYVYDNIDNIIQRFDERGDEYITSDKLKSIRNTYVDTLDLICKFLDVYTYDITSKRLVKWRSN